MISTVLQYIYDGGTLAKVYVENAYIHDPGTDGFGLGSRLGTVSSQGDLDKGTEILLIVPTYVADLQSSQVPDS